MDTGHMLVTEICSYIYPFYLENLTELMGRILNFFYKNIVCIGVLWWFQIYCGWSSNYVFEFTYLLFWNSFWTLCPVIAIGLFDRIVGMSSQ